VLLFIFLREISKVLFACKEAVGDWYFFKPEFSKIWQKEVNHWKKFPSLGV